MWEKISITVSSELGKVIAVPECRKYWDALRESTRVYLDRSKLEKISNKSGAPADLLDLYSADIQGKFDLYQSRWPFAEEMSFYIPSCARTAYTVSLGNSGANTRLKNPIETSQTTHLEGEDWSQEFDGSSNTDTAFISPSTSGRTSRSRKGDEANLDMTLITLATSVSEFVSSRSSQKEYKFKEFHGELDNILCELPFIEAMKFNICVLEQANELLEKCRSKMDYNV
ncbi:uncharacterized protein LOC131682979 [Topomyia yanbarensis]|uniref:uncharacterized protein LOC131681710 n=1 Tax=Topomyia yanbarensis TaxID=2498891 RepID=UPI00273BDFCD|nr:uncharacterized protein LOC131681710 [Topomyia yanbarensis]XP_058820792.1 uncharacterized protein LOC131682979 [Topomyia yanbarensis]